jgi:pimeloyl-ACP methyl ester carboxylesterase
VLGAAYNPSAPAPPLAIYRKRFREDFFYQLYFQEPGLAEAELDAAPAEILRRLYVSPDTPAAQPEITEAAARAGGMIARLGRPLQRPHWLDEEDMAYLVAEFARAGFHGGLCYYRNIDHNWELLRSRCDSQIELDALFMAGSKDSVVTGSFGPEPDAELIAGRMRRWIPRLARVALLPDVGHWLQEEAPDRVNRELLEFLDSRAPEKR